ncbi:hypothetical protein C798_11445 [Herbaspirillum rubrisubalbicans Os34]|uniref:Uncharacterized protein n=1 Tax=Herbaspirillum rubrisubalbicans Os34 TaxID=1235827 RepID=A0A6M3ZQB7_9BURK|nr:hypothetical protein C798_11445 [Herbaspirillum rubrisubalbicans Os34]
MSKAVLVYTTFAGQGRAIPEMKLRRLRFFEVEKVVECCWPDDLPYWNLKLLRNPAIKKPLSKTGAFIFLAETEGFEPSIQV